MHSHDENPGLLLDFKRFVTDTWASYVANQTAAIRAHADPRQFITTNTTHWGDQFDQYIVSRQLDMAAWDEYVPDGHFAWLEDAVQHDLVRGYKNENFWLMETQPAFVNWAPVNSPLPPYAMRELAWQAVGHGANAVLYWQWRSALNGQEQYHGTLLGADGTPVPAYGVVREIGAEMAHAAAAIAGTSPHSNVAMLQSYDSRWALEFQRQQADFDVVKEFDAFYGPLERYAQSVDVVSPDAPLTGYRLVVAPALNVLSAAEARRLADYVRAGGHLVLGPRSGMKDAYDALWPQRQPGPLTQLLGGRVEQYTRSTRRCRSPAFSAPARLPSGRKCSPCVILPLAYSCTMTGATAGWTASPRSSAARLARAASPTSGRGSIRPSCRTCWTIFCARPT